MQNTGVETSQAAILTTPSGYATCAFAVGTVLSVSPIEEDHNSLEKIFSECRWTVHRARTVPAAMSFLAENHAPVVICERELGTGTWRDVLDAAVFLPQPPNVVVTSRLADDYLWAEALQLGAYDVLAKPFKTEDVIRIAIWAARRWRDLYLPTGASVRKRCAEYDCSGL